MSASIELVTSHKGTPHITTEQVKDLLAGFSGDINGIKIFALDDEFFSEITDLLEITIGTGQALAGGYHFQLTSAYTWILDTENVGYSRIDVLYLVIYEDPITNVQSADFVYQKGASYVNGTSGTVPSAPVATNIKDTYAFMRADITDGAVVQFEIYGEEYLSNLYLANKIDSYSGMIEQNTEALDGLRFGVDSNGRYGYYKVGADTVTPFRNATGNATRADVLESKTFTNATEDNIAGTMPDKTGNKRPTVTPSGATTVETFNLTAGKYDSVTVDNRNLITTWVDTFPMGIPSYLDCSNILTMTAKSGQLIPTIVGYYDKNGNLVAQEAIMGYETLTLTFPSTARYVHITPDNIATVSVTYQSKQIRGK